MPYVPLIIRGCIVNVSVSDLIDFGNGLVSLRTAAVKKATSAAGVQSDSDLAVGNAIVAANAAQVATSALSQTGAVPPIGMLNLESLQMTPAGIERGGLLATIPLAPGERAEVVQQEWSAISS